MRSVVFRKLRSGLWLVSAWFYLATLRLSCVSRILWCAIVSRKAPVQITYHYNTDNAAGQEYAKYYVQALEAVALLRKVSSRQRCPTSIKLLLEAGKTDHVALFVIGGTGRHQLKIAIDSHDSAPVTSLNAYRWCDIYFKSNYWSSLGYGEKVRPIINGNGLLDQLRLRHIAQLREFPHDFDISCIVRIWAGPSFDPVHCLELLTQVSKIDCRKFILAVFCGFEGMDQQLEGYIGLCTTHSIPYTLEPIDYNRMIHISARSRVVVLRNGVSSCIPWRFLDMLCLGACVVFDHDPVVSWPHPLVRNQHYLSLDLFPPALWPMLEAQGASPKACGDHDVAERLTAYLDREDLLENVRRNAVGYYLSNCAPRQLGDYVLSVAGAQPLAEYCATSHAARAGSN